MSQIRSTLSGVEQAVSSLKSDMEWFKLAQEVAAATANADDAKKEVGRLEAAHDKIKKEKAEKCALERKLKENTGKERDVKAMEEQLTELKKKIKEVKDGKKVKSLRDSIASLKNEEKVRF